MKMKSKKNKRKKEGKSEKGKYRVEGWGGSVVRKICKVLKHLNNEYL